jgi:cyclophilin family peptidyl-prolyl cis-trans isomerase/protein-disulfide isomerase
MKKHLIPLIIFVSISLSACGTSNSDPTSLPPLTLPPPQSIAQCTAQSQESEDLAQPGDWINGATEGYAVTMIEYADFQCPTCAAMKPVLARLLDYFPDDIRFIFRHSPLGQFDKSDLAAQAAEAAGQQGDFWGTYGVLFDKYQDWVGLTPEEFKIWLNSEAETLGLDADRFSQDLNSDEIVTRVNQARQDAIDSNVPLTPYLLFDGQPLPDYIQTEGELYAWLEYQIIPIGRLANMKFSECPEITIDPQEKYTATLHTEKGDIVIALYADVAPFAVNNFIFLAESGFYNNTTFHRVIEGQIAQGGDPSGTSMGNPGYLFSIETSPDLKFDRPGVVAMANFDPYSNGSQFFISMIANSDWDGNYTIFGEVIAGMDVVESLSPRDPQFYRLASPGDLIYGITIEEK